MTAAELGRPFGPVDPGRPTVDPGRPTGAESNEWTIVAPTIRFRPFGPVPSQADAVDELFAEMAAVCASAVDSLEIAAMLESGGLTARVVRRRYGMPDVFALADELHQRSRCRPVEPPPEPDPWGVHPARHLLHALLYALPAACYATTATLLRAPAALGLLVASLVLSWALSQGLSYAGYVRIGRLDPGGAARLLRRGLAGSLVVLAVVVYPAAISGAVSTPALVTALAQGGYLLSATVLTVQGADLALLVSLVPGVAAAAAWVAAGRPERFAGYGWAPWAVCAVLATGAAVWATARPAPAADALFGVADLAACVPHLLFGLLAGSLLGLPLVLVALGLGRTSVPGAAFLTLPLTLSMGAAEWSLLRYRRRVWWLLRNSRTPAEFAPRARWAVVGAVLRYLAVAVVLTGGTAGVAVATGVVPADWLVLAGCGSYLALGGTLFVALLRQALDAGVGTLVGCAAALAVEVVLVTAPPYGAPWDVVWAQLVACTAVLVVLLIRAGSALSRVVVHV